MTVANEIDDQATQVRWREWQAAYVRASRRAGVQAKVVAVVAFSLVGAFLLMQLFAV